MRLAAVVAFAVGVGVAGSAAAGPMSLSTSSGAAQALDPMDQLLSREVVVPEGPVQWRVTETAPWASANGRRVDSLRFSVGGVMKGPGGLPLHIDRGEFDAQVYEVSLTRDWPQAWRGDAGGYDVDVSPHAGVTLSNLGGGAEAGAVVRLGKDLDDEVGERLNAMGVRDGASFGQDGRWYLFAAASGRAVGLNVLRGEDGWDRAGWSTDPSSALIGDAQVGVGYRKGAVQTSLGYIHREVKGKHMIFGQETRDDSVVAFSLSVKPRR